jgi:cellulose synthase (UDP-forming)
MMLKVACWPVFLAGTVLALARMEIPYIPTAKEAVRGHFLRLAWPHLLLLAGFLLTLGYVLHTRLLRTPEGALALSSEAVWGMVGFAGIAVLTTVGGLYGAWEARHPSRDLPWDSVDIETMGGKHG